MSLKATHCSIGFHRPKPMRFIYHHIQPKVAGGLTTPNNLIALCDSCHYSIHILLWHLAQKTPPLVKGSRKQRRIAKLGYEACIAAGTVTLIPKESEGL